MRVLSAEALLLEISDLSDGDRIVTFLTAEHGRKRGAARGAKRKYSRFAGQLQPLARVQLTWFEKDDRDLVRIRDLEVLRTAEGLRRSLEDLMLGSYLAEHVTVFAQENEENVELYRLLGSVLEALEVGGDRQRLLRYFEIWVLRIAGVLPYDLDCPMCGDELGGGAVLPDLGETLVCQGCSEADASEGMAISPGTLLLLAASRRLSPHRFSGAAGSDQSATVAEPAGAPGVAGAGEGSLVQLEEMLLRIRRRFLGFELKSHGVIRETMRRLRQAEQRA